MSGTIYHRKWRDRNRLKVRAYNLKYNRAWRKEHGYKSELRWKERNPEKHRAHVILQRAVAKGEIKKKPCVECGSKKVHAHHPDYKFPLKVIWVCPLHHALIHKFSTKRVLRAHRPHARVKTMKQLATVRVRLYPKTHRRLKIRAAKTGVTLADLIDSLALMLVGRKD